MIVRQETPADQDAIRAIHTAAFISDDNPEPVLEARIADELRAAGDAIPELSLVAERDGEPVGHVVVSRATLGGRPSLGLGPIGVLPHAQHAGIGSALMYAVLAAADALHAPEVVLLGNPRYYSRFGFEPAVPRGVIPPVEAWAQYFQVRTLAAWDDSRAGDFRYAPAFPEE